MLATLVLIEDDPDFRAVLAEMIESSLGIKVMAFLSIEEFLISVPAVTDELIFLSDIDLPGQSGTDFLKHLRDNNHTNSFFLMSGRVEAHELIKGLGCSAFFAKPFSLKALKSVLVLELANFRSLSQR